MNGKQSVLLAAAALLLAAGCTGEGAVDGGGNALPDAAVDDAGDAGVPDDAGAEAADTYSGPSSTNYIVVSAAGLESAGDEFAKYRESRGFKTASYKVADLMKGSADVPAAVREVLKAAKAKLRADETLYLLLLGDAPGQSESKTGMIPAVQCVNDDGECDTDNTYADLDGDGIPDVAAGRVPSRDQADALAYLAKLKRHETERKTGEWNRRINLYTGEAGFSDQIDAFLEYMVMKVLSEMNQSFTVLGAYNNKKSPYYYTPFAEKVVDLYSMGSIMTVYIGHGSSGSVSGFSLNELAQVHCNNRMPLAFFFACSNGEYLGAKDSIAEAIMRKADGAIASVGASGISHPYGNAILSYELERAAINERPATLGMTWLLMKKWSVQNNDDNRAIIDEFAKTSNITAEQQTRIKRQHLDLYNLFGDPAVSMNYPKGMVKFVPAITGTMAGGSLTVKGRVQGVATGTAKVSLEANMDMIIHDLAKVDPVNPDPATVRANWAKALDKVVAETEVKVTDGNFEAVLTVPSGYKPGTYFVKVYSEDGVNDAFGSIEAP
jgi:hypothetical protein